MAEAGTAETSYRAGFGRRISALIIDFALISIVLSVIGVLLALITDGIIRISNSLIRSIACQQLAELPPGVTLPSDFNATSVMRCTISAPFGIAHDWVIVVREVKRPSPQTTLTRTIELPTDRAGRPTSAFYLDYLLPFAFLAYLFLFEWKFGSSIGKTIVRVRVRSLAGRPIDAGEATRRTLMRALPLIPIFITILPPFAIDLMGMSFAVIVAVVAVGVLPR